MKLRSILNKLTPQKFEKLVQQILDLDLTTEDRLRGASDLIFEKAIDEPAFTESYAKLCKQLNDVAESTRGAIFKKLLMSRCKKEFDNFIENQGMLKMKDGPGKESQETMAKAKRLTLGYFRFIGEIFNVRMLKESIMHQCISKLLKKADEDSYESICNLLFTIGKNIDQGNAKFQIDQYFGMIEKVIFARETSTRIRFKLQDICDLRKNQWVPRREINRPKTIDEIHEEAKLEDKKERTNKPYTRAFAKSTSPRLAPSQERTEKIKKDMDTTKKRHIYTTKKDDSATTKKEDMDTTKKEDMGTTKKDHLDTTKKDTSTPTNIIAEESAQTAVGLPAAKELTDEEIMKKTTALMEEYFNINDIKEATLCIKEIETPTKMHMFVYNAINMTLEKSRNARKLTGALLNNIVKEKIIGVDTYIEGLCEVLEFADDLAIDIPQVWSYLGEIIAPLINDNTVPLNTFKDIEPLKQCKKVDVLIAEVLKAAA